MACDELCTEGPRLRLGHRRLASVRARCTAPEYEVKVSDSFGPALVIRAVAVATSDGNEVTTATAAVRDRPDGEPMVEVVSLVVDPAHRGRGLAEAVVADALRMAYDLGCDYAVVRIDAREVPAIRGFLRLGFEPEIVGAGQADFWAGFDACSRPDLQCGGLR